VIRFDVAAVFMSRDDRLHVDAFKADAAEGVNRDGGAPCSYRRVIA
jgi:hypothetical protein